MTGRKVLQRLVRYGPAVITGLGELMPARCILATRIGIDTLARFDIEAVPLPVRVQIANKAMVEWIEDIEIERAAGGVPVCTPEVRDARGAWLLDAGGPFDVELKPKHWHGHLMLYVPAYRMAIDLDFRQFCRPQKAILVPPALAFAWPDLTRDLCSHDEHGAELVVSHRPDNVGYRDGRDWVDGGRFVQAVDALAHCIALAVKQNA